MEVRAKKEKQGTTWHVEIYWEVRISHKGFKAVLLVILWNKLLKNAAVFVFSYSHF